MLFWITECGQRPQMKLYTLDKNNFISRHVQWLSFNSSPEMSTIFIQLTQFISFHLLRHVLLFLIKRRWCERWWPLFTGILEKIYRKRKKGVLKVDEEEGDEGGAQEKQPPPAEVEKFSKLQEDDDERQKKKSDDLWASFLSDVGSRPKDPTPASQSGTTHKVNMLLILIYKQDGTTL